MVSGLGIKEIHARAQFHGRLALQQRVLPQYRVPFFDRLAEACTEGLSVLAGEPRSKEAIRTAAAMHVAQLHSARNIHLLDGPFYLCVQPGIRAWLRSSNPRALILEANPRYISNHVALEWMKQRRRPVIGWGLGAPQRAGLLGGWISARRCSYLRRFDALIAYSTQGAQQYRKAGIDAEKVFVAPNAVSGAPPPLGERRPARERPARVLFVGRLQSRKRVDLLLRACSNLEARPSLMIVGEGPDRPRLERLASKLYPEAVFKGDQRGAALQACFLEADLFVLPGTGGLAVQQAMAHGLPVVVAEGDGTQRDLVGADNGWLVPPGDPQALKDALEQALGDPQRMVRMGAASHRRVAERINIEVMVEVFLQALRAVGSGE